MCPFLLKSAGILKSNPIGFNGLKRPLSKILIPFYDIPYMDRPGPE
jgi:hypothetical protein